MTSRKTNDTSQTKSLLSSSTIKIFFIQRLVLDILKDMNFMEAIEYGLFNLISSLKKKDRQKQWRAMYLTNTCLFMDTI